MGNQFKEDDVKLSGSTKVKVTSEGLNKIGTDGLKLVGKDASNYTLLGETHEFLFELKAKFKVKCIENVELFTIRHFDKDSSKRVLRNHNLILEQRTNEVLKLVVKKI